MTPERLRELAPGVLACALIAAASVLAADGLTRALGRTLIEPIVLALLLGIALRAWPDRPMIAPGAAFSAKPVLEAGVAIVGASIDLGKLAGSGIVIAAIVLLGVGGGLALSLMIARRLGLTPRLALLVAAGNSICGNSAIAAVGSVVGATKAEIASAIGLTAIAGLVMVLGLPVVAAAAGIDQVRYGVLTGMTVYAIPQVAAAAFPVGPIAGETAMLVKLTRVVLLAPITIGTALLWPRVQAADGVASPARPGLRKLVPWFVLVFLVLAATRTLGLIPPGIGDAARTLGSALLTVGMVGVGFAVDPQAIRAVGLRVGLATVLSLVVMIAVAIVLIVALGVPPAG